MSSSSIPSYSLEGGTLYFKNCQLETLSPGLFWNMISCLFKEAWDTFALGSGEVVSREMLHRFVVLKPDISPIDLVKLQAKTTPEELDQLSRAEVSSLHIAAYFGSLPLMDKALREGDRLDSRCSRIAGNFSGQTPLTLAFYQGNLEAFRWLLERETNLQKVKWRKCPVTYAYEKQKEFLPILAKYRIELSVDEMGYTNVHHAAKRGDLCLIRFFIHSGFDINRPGGKRRETPLLFAVMNNHLPVAELLISAGADIDAMNSYGRSIISFAAEYDNTPDLAIISLLLKNKVSSIPSVKNYFEPLDIALKDFPYNEKLIRFLIRYGFRVPNERVFSLVDPRETLFGASKWERAKLLSLLIDCEAVDLNLRNPHGVPLFHLALETRNLDLIYMFIDKALRKGIDPEMRDPKGLSSLHVAAYIGSGDVVRRLLRARCDPNVETPTKITPLHIAADRGNRDIVDELIEAGADVNALDYLGNTPLFLAVLSPTQYPIVDKLLSFGSKPGLSPECLFRHYKQGRLPFLRRFVDQVNESQRLFWKENALKKLCAHAFHIGGYSLTHEKTPSMLRYRLPLEGMTHDQRLLRKGEKILSKLAEREPSLFSNDSVKDLQSSLEFSSLSASKTSADYLERILNGEPTILYSGFWIHSVEFVFWGDLLAICNRGAESSERNPIEVFRFDPKLLTVELIESIRQARIEGRVNYRGLRFRVINKLNCEKEMQESLVEKQCSLHMQNVGNCTYANFEGAIWFLFVAESLANGKGSMKMKIDIGKARFDRWLLELKMSFVEKYLRFHFLSKNPYYPDTALFEKLVNLLPDQSMDPSNKERMQKIFREVKLLGAFWPTQEEQLPERVNSKEDQLSVTRGEEPTYYTLRSEYYFGRKDPRLA